MTENTKEVEEPLEDNPPPPKCKKINGTAGKFDKLLEEFKSSDAALFTHAYPDPDAIGSMMGMQWLLKKAYDIDAQLFYDGEVAHPQQKTMVNLLDPGLRPIDEYVEKEFNAWILLDTVPSHAGTNGQQVPFTVVIDHHKESVGDYGGLYINLKAGSCASTVYHIICKLGLQFDQDNDYDAKIATALMVGIMTDCENLMSLDTTHYESEAFGGLLEFKETAMLQKIVNYERPKLWAIRQAEAITRVVSKEGFSVVGLGIVPSEQRDIIADMAQQMVQWEDVNTAVVFASIDGECIEGSVRSINASMSVPSLCKLLGTEHGTGGGKLGKGAYKHHNYGTVNDDEGDETHQEVWEQWNKREISRIFRVIKK